MEDIDMEAGPSTAVAVKLEEVKVEGEQETVDKIIELCKAKPSGLTEKQLQKEMVDISTENRALALNRLLSEAKLELYKQGSQLLYRLADGDRSKGGDDEEKVVYSVIEEAGNKGIWIREIKYKSNLNQTTLLKVLKVMEGKKLVKSIKAVNASKRKIYMLYNIEPDRSVTGGAWYSQDQDFEVEYVNILNQQCYQFLKDKADSARTAFDTPLTRRKATFASSDEVLKHIEKLEISRVKLSIDEIESILETTIYDGLVEKNTVTLRVGGEIEVVNTYRAIEAPIKTTGLIRTPCGVCPVINDCHEGGVVSPSKCIYFNEWLNY